MVLLTMELFHIEEAFYYIEQMKTFHILEIMGVSMTKKDILEILYMEFIMKMQL
jgi:hypothetical protein